MPIHMKGSDLKKSLEPGILAPGLDDDTPHLVTPDHVAFSIAISLKRIADTLDDGLTTMTPDGKSVAGLADIAKSMEMKS